MVKRGSLLSRAMDVRRTERIPGCEEVLRLLGESDQTGPAWDALVGAAKSGSDVELAIAVLDEVALCYLGTPLALRATDQRAVIEAQFTLQAAALDVLEAAFPGLSGVRVIEGPETDLNPNSPSVDVSRYHPDLPPAVRMVLEVVRAQPEGPDASEVSFADPDAQSYNEHVRTARTAPAALRAMRRHLERERDALVAATRIHLTSRKRADGNAEVREFKFGLGAAMQRLVGTPCHDFVTLIATALYESANAGHTLEATRAVWDRERARRAHRTARDGD